MDRMEMDKRVSIAGCEDYEEASVETALDELFAPLGALDWVKPGMRIAIKANMVIARTPDKAATPHPVIARALTKRLVARGAEVVLGDSPGGPFSRALLESYYRITKLNSITEAGGTLNYDFGETVVKVPQGKVIDEFFCCDFLLKADAIIDLCKLKTHGLMGFTGACKNMFGGVTGVHKAEYHYRFPEHGQFASMLVDICEFFKPTLSICDGVVAMEGNGPSMGDPRHMGVLLASFNPHALDLAASYIIGFNAQDIPTLSDAVSRGLIPEYAHDLTVYGDMDAFRVTDFKHQPLGDIQIFGLKAQWFSDLAKALIVRRPVADSNCIGCGKCMEACPARAIVMKEKRPKIDRKKCISCFCCGEFCPAGAMKVYEPPLARMLHAAQRKQGR